MTKGRLAQTLGPVCPVPTVPSTGHIQVCIPVELSPHKGGRELSAPLPTTTTKLRRARSRRKKTGFTGRARPREAHPRLKKSTDLSFATLQPYPNHEPAARPRRRPPHLFGDPHHGTTNAEPVVPTEPVLARQAHTAVHRFRTDRGVRRPDADPAQPRNATGVHGYGDAVASMASRVLYAIAATPSRVPLRRGVASTASRGRASRNRRRSSA